jgi:sulfonate transport system substrate-binding protein
MSPSFPVRYVFLALAVVGLVGCGSSSTASTATTAATTAVPDSTATTAEGIATTVPIATTTPTTVAPTTTATPLPTQIPAGTKLRIGDQLSYLQIVLKLSGQDQNIPYAIEYGAFVGGPPMLQAFQAGSLDAGFVGSTPLIFAQAAKQDITAIATWVVGGGTYGLLSKPGDTSITGWAGLKGKKVAFQQGTAAEAALLQALDSVQLKLSDVTPVNLPITQIAAALQGGSADAGLIVEPLTSVYLAANPTAKEVIKTKEITDRSQFLIATKSALADNGKVAALADYVGRLVKAFKHTTAHPEQVADAIYVKQYKLPATRALEVAKNGGGTTFGTLPGEVAAQQQKLADLFQAAGEIPSKVDVSAEFDTRFNSVVTSAQAQ